MCVHSQQGWLAPLLTRYTQAYKRGLEIEPNNESMKKGLADVQGTPTPPYLWFGTHQTTASLAEAAANPLAKIFGAPDAMAKLAVHPVRCLPPSRCVCGVSSPPSPLCRKPERSPCTRTLCR